MTGVIKSVTSFQRPLTELVVEETYPPPVPPSIDEAQKTQVFVSQIIAN